MTDRDNSTNNNNDGFLTQVHLTDTTVILSELKIAFDKFEKTYNKTNKSINNIILISEKFFK